MTLSQSLIAMQKNIKSGCSIGRIFLQLEEEDKQNLQNALNSKMSRRDIMYALRENGFTLGTESIAKHKQERCGCKF